MRVLRGRAETIETDHARTRRIVERATDTGRPALRVWAPHPQVAFGRRDTRAEGYDRARTVASEHGYRPVEREVGGRAVAYTGSTVAFVHARPGAERTAIQSRYETAMVRLQTALRDLGVDAREGEPDGAFCPGTHSLQARGKIAGLAQRVRREVAVVAGVVVVCDHEAIAAVLDPVYRAFGIPFEPDAVGSVARAGGDDQRVVDALVDAFASSHSELTVREI